jgi:pantetheine-phosphate adenylyltransferase
LKIAICPGSFDPITIGHLDIIRRAAKLFDKVIVVVMVNYHKKTSTFTAEERRNMIERCTEGIPNVVVDTYVGLLAEYAKKHNAIAVVKGLRAVSDFEDEFQQALINKKLNPEVETVFVTAGAEHMFLSSSVVKQVCEFGGSIAEFVPPEIHDDIVKRILENKNI